MRVGSLVKGKHRRWIGVVVEVNKRDLSFYKSHTYLVQFCTVKRQQWCNSYEVEVLCE